MDNPYEALRKALYVEFAKKLFPKGTYEGQPEVSKIQLIKAYRDAKPETTLREAKDAVDAMLAPPPAEESRAKFATSRVEAGWGHEYLVAWTMDSAIKMAWENYCKAEDSQVSFRDFRIFAKVERVPSP